MKKHDTSTLHFYIRLAAHPFLRHSFEFSSSILLFAFNMFIALIK